MNCQSGLKSRLTQVRLCRAAATKRSALAARHRRKIYEKQCPVLLDLDKCAR